MNVRPSQENDAVAISESRRRRLATAAWGLAGLEAIAVGLSAWLHAKAYAPHAPGDAWSPSWIGEVALFSVGFFVFALVGAAIVTRRPRNAVGWVMVATGAASALSLLGFGYGLVAFPGSPVDPPVLALLAGWLSPVTSALTGALAFMILPLVFPDGRLPSPRWRVVVWAAVAFVATEIVRLFRPRITLAVSPIGRGEIEVVDIANPFAREWAQPVASVLAGAAMPLLLALALAAVAAVVVRFRRSGGVERQQMKWFVFAAIIVIVGLALITLIGSEEQTNFAQASLVVVAFSAYPLAVGVAVLRYRLYEIDRLVSRTVAYGLVVAVLAGVYVAGVVGLGAAMTAVSGQGGSDLVVAVSTLAVAALFRPVRARVQTAVDRRFNRTGYEARLAVDRFAHDAADAVDLDQIRSQLAETAAVVAQPTHVSVWLADGEEQRS